MAQGHLQKLVGEGLDIGAGEDLFRPVSGVCRPWDRKFGDGDASTLPGIAKGSLDYIYSSHCLEHLADPVKALIRWTEVLRPGGFLYLAVPDFDLYEGGRNIRNRFHKAAFSLHRNSDSSVPLFNLVDLVTNHLGESVKLWYFGLCDDNFDHSADPTIDQTRRGAAAHIEALLQKI